jgi:hypothetical protein
MARWTIATSRAKIPAIQRALRRMHALTADDTHSRLEPHHAAAGRRQAHRPARIRADRHIDQPRRDRRRRSAGRTAHDASGPLRIDRCAAQGFTRSRQSQFMHRQLAQQPPFTHRQQIGNQPGMARRGAASAKTALP